MEKNELKEFTKTMHLYYAASLEYAKSKYDFLFQSKIKQTGFGRIRFLV